MVNPLSAPPFVDLDLSTGLDKRNQGHHCTCMSQDLYLQNQGTIQSASERVHLPILATLLSLFFLYVGVRNRRRL